jgi:hypothetical protein
MRQYPGPTHHTCVRIETEIWLYISRKANTSAWINQALKAVMEVEKEEYAAKQAAKSAAKTV